MLEDQTEPPQGTWAHGLGPASSWVQRWAHLVKPGGAMLDVACGQGRHAIWFYERNHTVTVVDIAQSAIEALAQVIPANACEAVVADIENGPWPFSGRHFDVVVVTNYLWRPLMPTLLASLAPGGVLIYETFTQGNETVGKPSRPDFLLQTGELLTLCASLRVVAFEDGFQVRSPAGSPRFVQRIAAVRETATSADASGPSRYQLP